MKANKGNFVLQQKNGKIGQRSGESKMVGFKQKVEPFKVKATAERKRLDKVFKMTNQKHYGEKLAVGFRR